MADAAGPCRHAGTGHWFVDETYVKVSGSWRYIYRAVDEQGQGHCCIEPNHPMYDVR
jgi:IS6 family transposase